MNKSLERDNFLSRLSQISYKNKIIDADINYKTRITNKIKKLNNSTKNDLLPQIYAKAEKLNKKLSVLQQSNAFCSNSFIATTGLMQTESSISSGSSSNLNDQGTQSLYFDNLNGKDLFLKAYNQTRKRSMIVSKYLDDDMKIRLEQMKTFGNRRMSNSSDQCDIKTKDSISGDSDELNDLNINDADKDDPKMSSSQSSTYPLLKPPRNPRFGSTLSKDAQFALMKSLEDTIVKEIEKHYPDMKDRVPRTTTAQFLKRKQLDHSTESRMGYSTSRNTNTYENLTNISSSSSDNLRYESEIFNENYTDNNRSNSSIQRMLKSQQSSDLAKKLVVTQQIDSAMEILDNLRTNKRKSARKEPETLKINHRIHFNTSIDYSNFSRTDRYNSKAATTSNKLFIKPINKSRVNLNKSITPITSRLEMNTPLAKLETIDKYSEWKRGWMHQLENI